MFFLSDKLQVSRSFLCQLLKLYDKKLNNSGIFVEYWYSEDKFNDYLKIKQNCCLLKSTKTALLLSTISVIDAKIG